MDRSLPIVRLAIRTILTLLRLIRAAYQQVRLIWFSIDAKLKTTSFYTNLSYCRSDALLNTPHAPQSPRIIAMCRGRDKRESDSAVTREFRSNLDRPGWSSLSAHFRSFLSVYHTTRASMTATESHVKANNTIHRLEAPTKISLQSCLGHAMLALYELRSSIP